MPFDLMTALATSPYPQKLAEAAALIADSRHVEAVLLLEGTIASLEKGGSSPETLAPFRQLSAESLLNAAARFASSSPYSPRASQHVRIGWLEQALEQYTRLNDVPNQAHTLVALGMANLSVGEPIKATYHFKQALNLATPLLVLGIGEVRALFTHLADALQISFITFANHQSGTHYNMAVEGAAYRYLAGEPARAMADLGILHERYLEAAKSVHRSHQDDARAFRLLVQGIYWGLVTGHSDALDANADLLVHYATQVGDADAISVYDRAIALRQKGLHDNAQLLVVMKAKGILAGYPGTLDLTLFHEVIDDGSDYQIGVAERALKGRDLLNPHIPEYGDAKRHAALAQLTSWAQTINAVVPVFSSLGDRKMLEDFVSRGFMVGLQRAHGAFGEATRQDDLYRQATGTQRLPPMNPALARFISETHWQDPASARLAYAQLAVTFQCTPADVELLMTPRGADTPAVKRIRAEMGEYGFEQMRHAVITRGVQDQLKVWTEGRDEKGRR